MLPRPGQPQPVSQIIGWPNDVERLLDKAGQSAQAVEETAAVEVVVATERAGAFGYLGGLAEGATALAPTAGKVAGTLAGAAALQAALPTASHAARGRAGRPVRQQHERRHAAPALHAARRSSTSGSPASSRSSQSGFRVQAQSNHTPRPFFFWGLNPVASLSQAAGEFRAVTPELASAEL